MSKVITLVWLAAVVVVAFVAVSPAGAQPVAVSYPQAYRSGTSQTPPKPLSPQQRRQQTNQPAQGARPGDNTAYTYDGNPYTTGRAYEVPGGANGHDYNNSSAPAHGGRPLPPYQQPNNYQGPGHGNPSVPAHGGRPLPSYQQPYNYDAPEYGNPSVPRQDGRLSQSERPYNYDAPDYDGAGVYPPAVDPRRNVANGENGFWRFNLMGCDVVAADGTFLGRVSRDYNDPQSLANVNGPYGNPYSALSIYNPQGQYGSVQSPLSVWNTSTRTPPAYYDHGQFRCYLTSNRAWSPRVGPVALAQELGLQLR